MALKFWLPLNGTLENKGLSGATVSNTGSATVDANGKTGSCYNFNGSSNYMEFSNLDISSLSRMTICFWAYSTNGSINSVITMLDSSGYVQFRIFDGSIGFRDSQHSSVTTATAVTQPTANTWTHYAIVYDGGDWYVYKDATLTNTKTYTATATLNENITRFQLGSYKTSSYNRHYSGKLNDFRIYDHALSKKEISELSQALILNYPLDGGSLGNPNMILDSYYSASPWTGAIVDTEVYKGKTAMKVKAKTLYQNADSNKTIFPNMVFESGTQYTVSVDWCDHLRTDSNNTSMYIRFMYDDDTYTSAISPTANNDANWTHKVTTSTAGKTVSRITTRYSNAGTVSIANLKIEKGANETPWADGADATKMYDCSGYGRTGTVTGSPQLESNTPRYSRSTSFDGTSYVQVDSPSTEVRTIAFWAKWNSLPSGSGYSGQSIVFVDQKSKTGFGIYPSGFICTTNNVSANMFSKSGISAGTWYHFAIVNTGTSPTSTDRDLYINGVKQTPLTSNNYWTYTLDQLQIGKRSTTTDGFSGNLSDFRMYATALSAEKIKELYDTGAFVDNNQNLFCYEIEEDNSATPQIDKTGVFHSPEFTESTAVEIYEDEIKANQFIEI